MRCLRIVLELMLINERTHNNRQRNHSSKSFYSKAHWSLKAIRVTQIWLVDPFMQVKSAVRAHDKNYSRQISKQGAQADLKIF